MTTPTFCLLGCGEVFETIVSDPAGHGLPEGWLARPAKSVAVLSASIAALLDGLDAATTRVFVAVDQNALNYARLELYGAARLRGLRMASLIHQRAMVAPDARIDDNCWLGAGVIVGRGAHLSGDVMVHPGARIDAGARVGMHVWIGAGATVGTRTEIGAHCVLGPDVRLCAGLRLGKHCVIDTAMPWSADLPAGSFAAPQFPLGARMIGAGYSFEKQRH